MTRRLSSDFFGDKKTTEKVYTQFLNNDEIDGEFLKMIFAPYTSKLESIKTESAQLSLQDIFIQFIQGGVYEFRDLPFAKFSSVLEIMAHVFQHSFQNWLSKQESEKYFKDVVVRHSLFRPPHSVCVFDYDDLTRVTLFWSNHFLRFYEMYASCFSSSLNQILQMKILPQVQLQASLSSAKITDKQNIPKLA